MEKFYTDEKNVLQLIALLKAHNIKKVIASPGTTNITFIKSIQNDDFFEIYSCVDERSAAYMACGLATSSGEPVVISCTGATASRNYMPGLTEAFYRKLPIIAVTSCQHFGKIGQNAEQVIDRRILPNDIAKLSVQIGTIHNTEDEWAVNVSINNALLECRRHGGGPVHINLETTYSLNYKEKTLPNARVINRFFYDSQLPELSKGKTAIFVGSHQEMPTELTTVIDTFCAKYDAVVFCDHTSNYHGKYRILLPLLSSQDLYHPSCINVKTLIHIGDVSGAYSYIKCEEIWRVNPDGEIRDIYKKTRYVFEMNELFFFEKYSEKIDNSTESKSDFYNECTSELQKLQDKIPEVPFSNLWCAKNTAAKIPENSIVYLAILNTLRTWNMFELPQSVLGYSNTGGFGIDGGVSSLLGMSLASPQKLCFGIVGDLQFFYDLNSLGNMHVGKNFRLMLINNGCGIEFKNYNHPAYRVGANEKPYASATGHFGQKSKTLVMHYAQDLGFKYISASNKEEYLQNVDEFLNTECDKPILFEVFTDENDESEALRMIRNLEESATGIAKKVAKQMLGEKGVSNIKRILGR